MALQVGQQVGPYQIVEQLGQGGMAAVYKAYHQRLDRHVAIKVMHASFLEDPSFLARFEREAQIVARLEHPNIVQVYDYSEFERQPYLVMKQVEGRTLKAVLTQGALPLSEILRIMTPLADALTYAHKHGVLHRDIKPSNVILDASGTPYLTDFGLARIAEHGASTMSADVMLGTPQYISPEQAKGVKELDARTDIYSFGIMLYEMVTGRVPFNADTPYAVVHEHIYTPPPPPSQLNPHITPAVEAVLLKALAKEPNERYETATELMKDFRAAVEAGNQPSQVVGARHASPLPDTPPKAQTHSGFPHGVPPIPVTPPPPPAPPPPPTPPQPESWEDRIERWAENFAKQAEEWAEQVDEGSRSEQDRELRRQRRRLDRAERASSRVVASRFGNRPKEEDWDDDDERELEMYMGNDDSSIRKRVEKRLKDRRDFFGHLVSYVIVVGLMWFFALSGAGDGDINMFPLFVMFGWGSGLAAHGLSVYFKTGNRLEARERRVQEEMIQRYGADWQRYVDEETHMNVRRQVYKRFKKRHGFFIHAAVYLCINAMLWSIWALSGGGGGIPWPLFVSGGWGIGMFFHGMSALTATERGAESQEEAIQREMERERQRAADYSAAEKRKHDETSDSPPPVRLTEEGELTDSYVEDLEAERKRKRD